MSLEDLAPERQVEPPDQRAGVGREAGAGRELGLGLTGLLGILRQVDRHLPHLQGSQWPGLAGNIPAVRKSYLRRIPSSSSRRSTG